MAVNYHGICFITLAPGVDVIALYLFITDEEVKKARTFDMRAYPRGEHLKAAPLMQTLALLPNVKLGWKGLPQTIIEAHLASSSLMKKKKVFNIDTRRLNSKTFYGRNFCRFAIS
jgi:hypothetical protein